MTLLDGVKLKATLILVAVFAAGCATSGGSSNAEDKAARERSKDYFVDVSYVPAIGSQANQCTLPPGAEKSAVRARGQGPSKDWKDLAARAAACVYERNWRTLEAIANLMGQIDIDSPWGSYYLSVAADGSSDFNRALWMIDLAQKKAGGRSGLFLYQKGRVLYKMKEISKSLAEIKKAVTLEPKLLEAHLFVAEIHHRDLEFSQAETHYKSALDVDSKSYRALYGLAEVKVQTGEGREAAELYNRVIAAHPSRLEPWVRLAYVYESVEKNATLAIDTYKSLRNGLNSGRVKEKPDFDLNEKIRTLELQFKPESQTARVPAQASTQRAESTGVKNE